MSKIPAINEIDANSPSQESTEVVVKATTVTPDINEIQETISASATIQEIDGTRKPTISEIYKIVNDGLFESTTNWWDYAYKLSQAQINQDIISRLDNGVIGGGYSKGVDIITTTSNKVPSNTNVYSALKSDSLYPKKLNDEDINGIYDFLNGLTIGKPTAYTGGTWSVDKLGKTHLTTDYLYVRLKAIFETLQILNVDTIGGKLVISPAGSIRIAYVDRIKIDAPVFKHDEKTDVWSIPQIKDDKGNLVNETLNQEVYRCYFLGEQEGEKIENKWKVGDQAQAKSFNVKKGTYHKTGNHYLWRLVVGVSTDTVDIDGKKYHYVDLSQLIFDVGSDAPAPGDVLNQLGHKGEDLQRQTAIVLNAVDNYAPSITLYAGINDFTLLNKEYVDYGVYQGKAFFNVYGDMYVGDKGANPKTYIKFKNGKIDIKANLTIGSSIDGKDLDKYIKENGGVDEKTVISLINNSQVIKDLQNQADGAIETWFYEGEPTLKNLPAVDWTTNDIKKIHVGDLYYDQITGYAYRFTKYNDDVKPYDWNRIKDNDVVKALEAANKAQATADSKMKIFYGETKPTNYQAGDMWVNATLAGKFDNDIARSTTTSKTFNADHWVLASRYSEAIQTLLNWSNQYTTKFEDLTKIVKEQKDQSITNWFYDYEPTDANAPANLWNTEELRKEHIGDIFYDTKNNHSYRWTGSAWSMIKDADFDEAMKKAKDAEDLADKKRQIFYSDTTPTGADRGDLWMKQVGNKTEVWVFDGTNWVKSNDKALADYSEAINKELEGIKGQLDGKAETWYQADDPSTNWTNKTSHEGDIWYNTTDGTTQYWNGTKWEKMDIPKDVFDTIDGKSSIFVDSYDDAKAGKGVISNGYNERDIWILPADAIVNGVQYYKGDILTATADGTVFNEKHWTKKVRYVGDKELTAAIDKVNKKINDISATTLPGLDNKFNEFAKDGIIDSSEKARLTDLLNQANNDVLAANDQITSIIKSDYLDNDNVNKGKLIEAQKTLSAAWNEYKTLINTLIASENPITKNNIAEASSKYTNLQNSIKAVKQYLAACQADMLSNIGIDINSYKYLKEAFKGKTEVNGGLVVTNVLQLRQTSDVNSPITAGISGLQGKADENGVVDKDTYDITSIAAWFGGPMVDKNIFTDEQLKNKVAGTDYARSLFRHDGSGYLSSGAIYWGTDGILHGNPNSFILQGTSLATMFNYVRLFYLHYANNQGEGIAGVDYITPTKTFSRLDILTQGGTEAGLNLPTGLFIGNATTGGSFQVGNIIIRTKKGEPNVLEIVSATDGKTAHLGVQGGVSAYGTYTPSTGGGGGLNAGVVSYANIIAGNYSDTDLTTIPNAYSIKALYNAIQNIDVTSQLGNYLLKTDAADTYQPKGNYLTTHQTIYGLTIQKNGANLGTYNPKSKAATINVTVPTKISELSNDSGYTNNIGTVTSVGISVPTGLSATNSPITTKGIIAITFAEGYSIPTIAKQTSWDNISTLESYFNNGSAKKALQLTNARKLWGNSFNGTSDINGSIIVPGENYISIGDVKLIYDATNKALKIDGNLYSTGGISAYGTNNVAGGGGLNASVISYASILEGSYVDTDLTSIPNAYSVKALSNRIDNIATELGDLNLSWNNITGKPTTFTPSAHKHKWVDITDRITKVSQLTNDAGYLTTHQSLSSYYTKAEIDAKGYTTNKGTVTSIGLTLPTGLTCATKSITTSGTFAVSFASGYSIPTITKQTSWDSAVSVKHSHSNKSVLDGISSAKVTHWDSAYDWYALITTDEETADGIINKWNEVVSFLANIAQTDTLSGIVDGINKSISDEVTRAKKAEGVNASGISTNKTNITTLQGYFTSGSAKKALQLTNTHKLWGNSFNGTADINGSIIVPDGKYISIGNIKMEYDATNKALKITNTTTNEVANLYTSGGVSAYVVGTSSSSGGGLNGSVKAYADAIRLTTENLSEIASAYSVAKLYSEIQNVASAVPSISVSVPTVGNALTGATYDASTGVITFAKGTFLTAHQSLDGYVNAIAVSGSGNAVTAVTKSGKTITFTKGATYLTSHQSLAAYLKSADAASTYAVVGHTHKVKINGAEKTINPSTGTIVDLGTYLTSHQSLAAYMKTADANNTFSKIGHTHGYASSVKLGETSYAASNNVISLPAYPTALKSPTAITIQANGISLGSYDGSTAKTFNLTYANVGAASAGHNHDSVYSKLHHTHPYLPLTGGTLTGGLTVNSNVTSSGIGTFKVLRVGSVDIKVDDSGNLYIINKDGKTAANFYATGGITAYGASDGTSSGGGLNGSVKSYADALKLTSESLSEIASAYSIKALDSRISSLEGGSATAISVSGSGNAVTSVTKNGTTISVVKGSTFLTSHQSLDGYVNAISVSGSGNAITSVSKSGKGITFTKGATFLTSHQSLANYYTKSSVDSLLSGKSATSHTHSVKINGVTKTIAATGGTAVDLGTYLTSHQSLNGYATQSWVKSQGYLTSHQDVSILNMANDRYYSNNAYGINMRNSDIIGVNSVYTQDLSDSPTKAILFCRSNGNYDGIRAANGVLYFSNNVVRTTSKYDAEYEVYHKGNLTKLSQLTNDKNFVTGSVSGQTITINGVSTTWQNTWRGITDSYSGTSTGTSLSQKGANSLYNALHNGYASSAGNADTVDGVHVNQLCRIYTFSVHNTIIKVGTLTSGQYGHVCKLRFNSGIGYNASNQDKAMTVVIRASNGKANSNGFYFEAHSESYRAGRFTTFYLHQTSKTQCELYMAAFDYSGQSTYEISFSAGDLWTNEMSVQSALPTSNIFTLPNYQIAYNDYNVASATKLQTARTIWGQSFDGTGNVSGFMKNVKGLVHGDSFKEDWSDGNNTHPWYGIDYRHCADSTETGKSYTSISSYFGLYFKTGGSRFIFDGGNVGIGTNSPAYKLHVIGNILSSGNITSSSATINGTTTINGQTNISSNLSVGGLITNQGILPANSGFNNKGANCIVSADALCSGLTAITDSIPVDKVTIQYSNNNGSSWNNLNITNDNKFKMYTNSAGINTIYLGNNFISGSTNAEKLSQVKKNELIFSFYFPDSCYSQIYFACVDISNGVNTICTVEIVRENGEIADTYTKEMFGWNKFNYINFASTDGNDYSSAGNSYRRVVRFRFKHNQNTTELRNACINKIRIFAFTKFSFPTDRFMGHTGHIYNFDYNMNTYFPNSVVAKGGVTAYQSSDIRLKTNINKLNCLNVIKSIGGTYEFDYIRDRKHSIGFIAQNVSNPLLKDIVAKDDDGYLKINYWNPKLISLAFGALTEIDDEVDKLKARVTYLESEVERLINTCA